MSAPSNFVTADPPRFEDYSRCVHCGLCLNACPTFRVLGQEMDSPRGRLFQVAQADAGRLPVAASFFLHMDRCLVCRACETACPSGVEYGKVIERARAESEAQVRRPLWQRAVRAYLLEHVLVKPRLLAWHARALRLYQRSGLQRLARRTPILRWLGIADSEALAPIVDRHFFSEALGRVYPAEGTRRARVAFLAGCIQQVAFAGMNRATIRVLQRNGVEVVVPRDQGCCGALHVHAGLREFAGGLARHNIAAFERAGCEAIITNSAGCGSTLKEYGDLLATDTAWQARGAAFAGQVRDVTEFLAAMGLRREGLRPVSLRATYQDPCHLLHGQKIRSAPRELLQAVPGLELVELAGTEICCGSAGIYNIVHPEIARPLLEQKMDAIRATGATLIVTANPGCQLQLRAGVASRGTGQRVLHIMELLDEAYGGAMSSAG